MKKILKIIGILIVGYFILTIISGIFSDKIDSKPIPKYKVTKEKGVSYKKTIYLELQEKVTEKDLENIAYKQKEKYSNFTTLFIFYHLKGQDTNDVAWATTHFTPELSVNIIGTTIEDDKKPEPKITGNIINEWYDNNPITNAKIFLVEENGKKVIKTLYLKTKKIVVEKISIKKQKNGLLRYNYKNKHKEYYLVEKNGNLSLYDKAGKFREYKKVK